MAKKKPNNWFAPFVIAGVTIGLLASAYKFIFANDKPRVDTEVGTKEEGKQAGK